MYVGVVVLLRNLPLYGGRFDSPPIRDLESRRYVLTGQSTGWALVYATSRRSLRLLCGEYGQIECKNRRTGRFLIQIIVNVNFNILKKKKQLQLDIGYTPGSGILYGRDNIPSQYYHLPSLSPFRRDQKQPLTPNDY